MSKCVAVAGASGVLGMELIQLLSQQSYRVRSIIRDPQKRDRVEPYSDEVRVADASHPDQLRGCLDGVDIVITVIGKSVSLFTSEAPSFYDIDFVANLHLLHEAQQAKVPRFVYVSIFGSETSPELRQGWMQERFSQVLMKSGLSYTVIKPVGFFSGLHDLIIMAKSGLLFTPGDGTPKTNPIHQRDLAKVCVDHLESGPEVLNVGGPEIHTRNEVAKQVCQMTRCKATLNIPKPFVKFGLGLVRLINRNLYDKLSFFTYITTHDMVAPKFGSLTFENYLKEELSKV
uniref:NAD(P)H-binding protein n=1 Tax=Roseihalotalea indica TaxID=2867963 RepID=A0AA49GJ13_9BACT|nr:NAD(P)H-binding protein [Tunicatimonas sp. TK19036]